MFVSIYSKVLSLCGPNARAKVTRLIFIKCSKNLNLEPEKIHEKSFQNKFKPTSF